MMEKTEFFRKTSILEIAQFNNPATPQIVVASRVRRGNVYEAYWHTPAAKRIHDLTDLPGREVSVKF